MANLQVLLWFRSNSHRQEDIQVFAFRRYSTVEPPKHLIVKRMTAILMLLISNLDLLKMELKWSLHLERSLKFNQISGESRFDVMFHKNRGVKYFQSVPVVPRVFSTIQSLTSVV